MNNIKNINTKNNVVKNEEIEIPIEDFLGSIGLGPDVENF